MKTRLIFLSVAATAALFIASISHQVDPDSLDYEATSSISTSQFDG